MPLPGVKLTLAVLTVTLAMLTAVGAVQEATVVNTTVPGTEVSPPAQLLTTLTVYIVPGCSPLKLTGEAVTGWLLLAGLVLTV